MKLDEKIFTLRMQSGLSREDFASRVEISTDELKDFEMGNATPEVTLLLRIAKALNVTVDFLLDDEQIPMQINKNDPITEKSPTEPIKAKPLIDNDALRFSARRSVLKNAKLLLWGIGGILLGILAIVLMINATDAFKTILLVIGLLGMIGGAAVVSYAIIDAKSYSLNFYGNYAIARSGVFNKIERRTPITKVMSVSVRRSFWGQVFNYGNVYIDFVGKGDHNMIMIKNPNALKKYVQSLIDGTDYDSLHQIVSN